MVLCPRSCEGSKIQGKDGDLIGPVCLNGTLLGGTVLVKSEAEFHTLKSDNSKLEGVLGTIGTVPNKTSSHQELRNKPELI